MPRHDLASTEVQAKSNNDKAVNLVCVFILLVPLRRAVFLELFMPVIPGVLCHLSYCSSIISFAFPLSHMRTRDLEAYLSNCAPLKDAGQQCCDCRVSLLYSSSRELSQSRFLTLSFNNTLSVRRVR